MPLEAKTTSKFDVRYCTYFQEQKTGKLATKEMMTKLHLFSLFCP